MMRFTTAAVLGIGLLWAGPARADDHSKLDREGIQLVRQLEEVGRDVSYHTGRLSAFTANNSISRWTHYHHLDEIKRLVNTGLRPAIVRLKAIQSALPAWKQKSVDELLEASQTLAADTTAAFMTKAENPLVEPAMNEEYKTLVAEMHRHAESVVTTSEFAASFAEAYLKLQESGVRSPTS